MTELSNDTGRMEAGIGSVIDEKLLRIKHSYEPSLGECMIADKVAPMCCIKYIVELEHGVWLADGDGDPARTTIRGNALGFDTLTEALMALIRARRYREFRGAIIRWVEWL